MIIMARFITFLPSAPHSTTRSRLTPDPTALEKRNRALLRREFIWASLSAGATLGS
jgi:hypothetical protein